MKKQMIFFTTGFKSDAHIFLVRFSDGKTVFLPRKADEAEERAFYRALCDALDGEIVHYAGETSFFPQLTRARETFALQAPAYTSRDLYMESKKLLPYRVSRHRIVEELGLSAPVSPYEIQKLYKKGATQEDLIPFLPAHQAFLTALDSLLEEARSRFAVEYRGAKVFYLPDGYHNGAYTGTFQSEVDDLYYVTPAFLLEVKENAFRFVPEAKEALLGGSKILYHDARYMQGIAAHRNNNLLAPEDFLLEDGDGHTEIDVLYRIVFETMTKEVQHELYR